MASQIYKNSVEEWEETLLQCPYLPSHQIRPARFGHHLVQCRNSLSKQPTSPYYHKLTDLVVCSFNSHHHIPKEKMKEHVKKCQGAVVVLKEQLAAGPSEIKSADDGISAITSGVDKIKYNDDDDDWDDEVRPAYNPAMKAVHLPMHMPAGLTPAERRNYKIAKRYGDVPIPEASPMPEPVKKPASNAKDSKQVPIKNRGIGRGSGGVPPGFPSNGGPSKGRGKGRGRQS